MSLDFWRKASLPTGCYVLISVFFLVSGELAGRQVQKMDSLEQVYSSQANDSIRVAAAKELTFFYIFNNPTRAKELLRESLSLAEKAGKNKSYYELYQNLGIYYDVNQQTDSSYLIFQEILEASKAQNWSRLEERSLNNLGMNSLNRSKYEDAIRYFNDALTLSRQNPESKESDWVNSLSNLGLANQELELYDQAIKYHLEALEIRKRMGNKGGMAISSANLGICYKLKGNEDEAIAYYKQAITYAKDAGNLTLYHRVHDNLGSLYNGLGQYQDAITNLNIALDTSDGYKIDPKMELSILSNLAAAHIALRNRGEALDFANRGLKVLEAQPELVNYSPTLKKSLAKIYFSMGDISLGSKYLEEYEAVNREIFKEENAELLSDLQVKYEVEKKESQLALQQAELTEKNAVLQRNYFAFAALGLFLVLLVAIFIFYQNRNKRNQELLIKDREIRVKEAYIQASMESQEQERRRMAQDLHDGFGQYISALRLYVSQLKSEKTKPELKAELVGRTDDVLDEMSKEISNVVYDLMPATLIRHGLMTALEDLAARISISQKAKLDIESRGISKRLDELVEINLFRICQEWINNVLKYSGAKQILIDLSFEEGMVRLNIFDDGRGFDPNVFLTSKGNGWRNLHTRADLLQAKVKLNSKPEVQGTELSVSFAYFSGTN
ncbi:tetratricopeptide repeat-containing sensor histidine kinase [Algoriphagus litoralis]|uniref:tetratricopeptide repeat-containing sensor histidine kinase n=1 Tax=Algoriphagus litoralis TaxID=2202829 RepID=UPI000DB9C23F|nr:tetratricopeptide repeat protein [Algoriphagus litoralis]